MILKSYLFLRIIILGYKKRQTCFIFAFETGLSIMSKDYKKDDFCVFVGWIWTYASRKKLVAPHRRVARTCKPEAASVTFCAKKEHRRARAGSFCKKVCRKRYAAYIWGPRKAAGFVGEGGATEWMRDGVYFEKKNAVANDTQSATTCLKAQGLIQINEFNQIM